MTARVLAGTDDQLTDQQNVKASGRPRPGLGRAQRLPDVVLEADPRAGRRLLPRTFAQVAVFP